MESTPFGTARRAARPSRAPLLLVLPVVLLQLAVVLPLVLGARTLYLRDVLQTHLPMREATAAALYYGRLPVLDVQRGGGQPALGNLDGAPLYPSGLLDLLGAPYWSLGAHFWLHFLLAPWCFAWLARRLGCSGAAAWAGGVAYALSGWFLSQMSYYNLVAGAALAPAFAAACIAGAAAAAGALWALLLLAGDPTMAALAAALAIVALTLGRERGTARATWRLLLALALGTLAAAPQLGELLRALPTSTRAVRGFDVAARTLGSWDPRQVLEQLLPLAFGRVDRVGGGGFWAYGVHTGALPFLLTLYPGLLALALAATGVRRSGNGDERAIVGARRVALVVLAIGLLLALGRFDPLLAPLLNLPGASLLRFPVKAWLLVAAGIALLAARGWDCAFAPAGGHRGGTSDLRRALLALAALLLTLAVAFALLRQPLGEWMRAQLASGMPDTMVSGGPRRWLVLAAGGALLALVLAVIATSARHRPLAAALLLATHAAVQLLLLAPATLATERVDALRLAPALAARLPAGSRVAHGSVSRLFGPMPRQRPPGGSARWLARQGAAAGLPFVGVPLGWRYDLALSPEGLDGIVTRLAVDAVRASDDATRVRLLRAWGIDALLLERTLAAGTPGATLLATVQGPLAPVALYRIDESAPPMRWVGRARVAAAPGDALRALVDPGFDARHEVVLASVGAVLPETTTADASTGRVVVERDEPERLAVTSDAPAPGWLVVERTWQPRWGARVDGAPAAILLADLQRMAVALPAGSHRVELAVDRAPLRRDLALAALGALGLAALGLASRRRVAA